MNFSVISTVSKDTVVVHRTLPITVIHRAKGGTGMVGSHNQRKGEVEGKTEMPSSVDEKVIVLDRKSKL